MVDPNQEILAAIKELTAEVDNLQKREDLDLTPTSPVTHIAALSAIKRDTGGEVAPNGKKKASNKSSRSRNELGLQI